MPLQPTLWADAFGMLVDRFGTQWMVNVNAQGQYVDSTGKVTPAEQTGPERR